MTRFHPLPFRPHIAALVLALMAALPLGIGGSAQAAPPPPPSVTLAVDGQPMSDDPAGCIVALRASWQADEVRGAFVNTRLYQVIDGSDVLVGAGFRIPDDGSTHFRLRNVTEATHAYRFELVRGGQERVLASDSLVIDLACP